MSGKRNITVVIFLTICTTVYIGLFQHVSKTNVIKFMWTETTENISVSTKKSKLDNHSQRINTNETMKNYVNYPLNIDMVKLVKDVKEINTVLYKPVNVYKYKLVKNCESVCELINNTTSKLLLFAIKSAATNFHMRKVIRETWGQEITLDGFTIKRVFVLGLPNKVSLEKLISNEYKNFSDILQYNFDDRYYNNTLKTIGTINWITAYCKQVYFVLFVDDDYFVSPHNLVAALKRLKDSQEKTLYMGHVSYNLAPVRHPDRKWYVSLSEYPYTKYPLFINAGSYVMSIQTVIDIQIAIQYTQLFRLDDVYLGIVASKLHINLLNNRAFHVFRIGITKAAVGAVITSHGFRNPTDLIKAWEIHTQIIKSRLK